MSEQIATNGGDVTMRNEVRFPLDVLGADWTVLLTEWSDGTHTVDASRLVDPWPVPMQAWRDEYEIDLGTDTPTVARIIEAIDSAVEARAESSWESYLSNYYGG
jgi:hypothetical protein